MTAHAKTDVIVARPCAAVYSFGPFKFSVCERTLQQDGERLRLGGRATDILAALCARPGEVVSKEELLRAVWGDQHVDDGSLRVHISELRKVLGGGNGPRYIINVPGQGYSFIAVLGRSNYSAPTEEVPLRLERVGRQSRGAYQRPPFTLTRTIGREQEIASIAAELRRARFITIAGAGGVGKTTVAVAVADFLQKDFGDNIVFVDLSLVERMEMVQAAFVTALGLPVRTESELSTIVSAIQENKTLLIVDNCEHVVEQAAEITQHIHALAPNAYILVTSREPLHIPGEQVHRLPQLLSPTEDCEDPDEIAKYPAVELFMERVQALDGGFELTDHNARAIANICRTLDGLALAIEFAAARVAMLGTEAVAGHLGQQLDVLDKGRRTASPRHQTLRLTLDWSYTLLADDEKAVLRCLGVFAGSFSLSAAQAILGAIGMGAAKIANCIADLVDKSLVYAETSFDPVRFRLLNTTRDYAAERLGQDRDAIDRAHARYYLDLVSKQIANDPGRPLVSFRLELDNVRRALSWSFSPNGDVGTGISLAIASADLFWDLALLTEIAHWSAKGLESLASSSRGSRDELDLMVNGSLALLFTRGNSSDVAVEIGKTLTLAKSLDETDTKERILSGLFAFHLRGGDTVGMQDTAREALALANRRGKIFDGTSDSMLATSLAFTGNFIDAELTAGRALSSLPILRPISLLRTGIDQRAWALNCLSLVSWMRGSFDRARALAADAITETNGTGHPVPEAIILIWTIPLCYWAGETRSARERVARLAECAAQSGLLPFRLAADAHRGVLRIFEGNVEEGIDQLRTSIGKLRKLNSRMLELVFSAFLADGYAKLGSFGEARDTVDRAIELSKTTGVELLTPGLLHKRAVFGWELARRSSELLSGLEGALEYARAQANVSAELSILTEIVSRQANFPDASLRSLRDLRTRYLSIKEGFETPAMLQARSLLGLS